MLSQVAVEPIDDSSTAVYWSRSLGGNEDEAVFEEIRKAYELFGRFAHLTS